MTSRRSEQGAAAIEVAIRGKRFAAAGMAEPRQVLGPLAFRLEPGSVTAIAGPSGVGKSTLLALLGGLDREVDGRIDRPADARIGHVFQEPRLLPWRTVAENLRLAADAAGRRIDGATLRELLDAADLGGAGDVHPTRLSLGMARRVAILRAFVIEPAILLLDEPFVSLDEPTAARLRDLLTRLLEARPTTTVLVTHDLRDALRLATRLLVLGGHPAGIVLDMPITATPEQRSDRLAVEIAHAELEPEIVAALGKGRREQGETMLP